MDIKQNETRCKARTKAGKPCRAFATEGGLCFFHANPRKASELGRIGGRSKRPAAAESGDPLPALDNAMAVRETVDRLISDVLSGKLQPKVASVVVPLINLQMRAIERCDYDERLAKLEEAADAGKKDPDPSSEDSIQGLSDEELTRTLPASKIT